MSVEEDQPSEVIDDEHVQLSLDSKLQTYMAQMSQKSGCCGTFFPLPFERAAKKSWWDPTFDSDILEEQYRKSSIAHITFKFRYALWYLILVSTSWLIYFLITGLLEDTHPWILCAILACLVIGAVVSLFLSYTRLYIQHTVSISLTVVLLLAVFSLGFLVMVQPQPVGSFSICVQILVLIYTLIPLKLYMSLSIGVFYSIGFEVLSVFLQPNFTDVSIVMRLLCHFAIHLIGFHIYLMSNVRMRNTFIKVGQSLLVRRQLELEKKLKENMIHSLMPPSVAHWLLHEDDNFIRRHSSDSSNDIRSIFRPFNMDHKENVSILFADIVGFTRMSTNKSAEELVEILNNIFQRFDVLCKQHNCEKISTLGDCYYCVSGCPEAREDHANCCVEMGLGMVEAIKQFDQEKNEGINIRVGVHTGTVLCGIVGTKRFKFDVWSNDVTLANRMESTGRPGMVHISEKTNEFLQDTYQLEEGEAVFGLKTYFVLGKKGNKTPSYSGSFRAEGRQRYTNSLQLFVSPPATSPSLSPQSRPRVLSCDPSSNYIKPNCQNPNMLSPDVCKIKANSLPSILDIENEQDPSDVAKISSNCVEVLETPISNSSSKVKKLKFPKFMRKTSAPPRSEGDGELDPAEDGYQQVPTIIQTNTKKESSVLNISEIDDENIDIKSYISQSRCDIGQYDYSPGSDFVRGGSYRSKYGRSPNDFSYLHRASSNRSRRGRSPNFDVIEPTERCRSATVAIGNLNRPKKTSIDAINQIQSASVLEELSISNSRKDSGIKSNSRRSSVQQIDNSLFPSESNQHRVSGYYTSSQSSIYTPQVNRIPGPFFDKFGECIQNLRKQSDRQLIKCVQDNSKSRCSYFIKPPLSQLTLFFTNKKMEREFRVNVHSINTDHHSDIPTLANSSFNTYLDMFVSAFVFLVVSIGVVLVCRFSILWMSTFLIFITVQAVGLAFCFSQVIRYSDQFFFCMSRFFRWNLFGSILVSLPLISAVINFIPIKNMSYSDLHLYTYLLFVGIVHFCNFTQLNCWLKNIFATIFCLVFVTLFLTISCEDFTILNNVTHYTKPLIEISDQTYNITKTNVQIMQIPRCNYYKSDILLNLFLLLVLIWLLNREFEIGYRLSFHANFVANRDKIHVQSLKNQADYLIYNIVPEHVADQLKKDAKYSENFKNVAIIFASIVNFNEMYDESYEGGKEFLRVLNELIGDFDELLERSNFRSVEKIKTIGSTFMAASGLNSHMRQQQKDPNEHLYALMDFALEMQKVVNEFNRDLLEFNLILRVGYNFGDVTAAVIGNTKLYYDIWGDAVNIASRMDSTGVNGRIQVGESCLQVLESKYDFEPRGYVYVKGKDHMNVYLLKKKKTPDLLCVPEV